MTSESVVTIRLNSASLFEALQAQIGPWQLQQHTFDPHTDEVHVSHDSDGGGRIALTIAFELDKTAMAAVLNSARPAG